jgi:hypothetical protein
LLIQLALPHNFLMCVLLSPFEAFAAVSSVAIESSPRNSIAFDRLLSIFPEGVVFDLLPRPFFARLFRVGRFAATLWPCFLLAQRLMKQFGLHPWSLPDLPDMVDHALWCQFDAFATGLSTSPQISAVSDLYCLHLSRVVSPSRHSRVRISLLLGALPDRTAVLPTIASFMRSSP